MNEVNCPNCKDSHTRNESDHRLCTVCGYTWSASSPEKVREVTP